MEDYGMKRKKAVALGLSILLAFSAAGCGDNGKTKDTEQATSSYETKDMKLDTNVMAVGEAEITLNEMLFYVYQLKAAYDGSLTSKVWKFNYEGGKEVEDYAKEQMIQEIAQVKIICQQAKKEGVTLTEEESNEAKVEAEAYVESLPESAKEFNLTKELVTQIYQEHSLAKKMYDVVAGTIDTNISDDEAKQVTIQYIHIMTSGIDRNGNEVNLTDEEKQNAKKRAARLLEEAIDAEDFGNFAQNNSDEETTEMTFSKTTGEKEFVEQAFSLAKGELSEVIETENGYYILYCKEPYDEAKTVEYKENVLLEREKEAFQKAYKGWKDQYKTVVSETLMDQISFD